MAFKKKFYRAGLNKHESIDAFGRFGTVWNRQFKDENGKRIAKGEKRILPKHVQMWDSILLKVRFKLSEMSKRNEIDNHVSPLHVSRGIEVKISAFEITRIIGQKLDRALSVDAAKRGLARMELAGAILEYSQFFEKDKNGKQKSFYRIKPNLDLIYIYDKDTGKQATRSIFLKSLESKYSKLKKAEYLVNTIKNTIINNAN